MTKSYNRTAIFNFNELPVNLQSEILEYMELSDAHSTGYVILKEKEEKTAIPLSMFIRTNNNNFTHAVYGLSYFSCYCLTLSRCGTEAVIAYKYL